MNSYSKRASSDASGSISWIYTQYSYLTSQTSNDDLGVVSGENIYSGDVSNYEYISTDGASM